MAWDLAAYAITLAVLLAAGMLVALMWQANRTLRRWDRMAEQLTHRTEGAIEAYARLAEEACETAAGCNRTLSGFSRLAEGARAMGDAAETAAIAATHTAAYWHERLTSVQAAEGGGPAVGFPGLIDYLRGLGRRLATRHSADPAPEDSGRPEASADYHSGE